MLTAPVATVPSPCPVASHRPGGSAVVLLPATMRSGVPSSVRSPSFAGGLIVVPSNHTVSEDPRLPPADRALTVSVLTRRESGTLTFVLPVALTVTGGWSSTWYVKPEMVALTGGVSVNEHVVPTCWTESVVSFTVAQVFAPDGGLGFGATVGAPGRVGSHAN